MYSAPPPIRLNFLHPRVWLAWGIFGLNILVFLGSLLLGFSLMGSSIDDVIILIRLGAKFSPLIDLDNQWWRLLTAMILHGGLIHLAFNSYALYILGPEVERLFGTLRFLAIYLGAGLVGSVASYMFGLIQSPAIGASGAIFGLMGALGAFSFNARSVLGDFARRNLRQIVVLAVLNLFIGFSIGGIDNLAHIGGLTGGVLIGLLLAPQLRLVSDGWNRQIVADYAPSWRWLGVVVVVAVALAGAWFVHQQRLADPQVLFEMRNLRQEYLNELRLLTA